LFLIQYNYSGWRRRKHNCHDGRQENCWGHR